MHVEDKEFTFRIEFRAAYADDYEGDDDGNAWVDQTRPITAEMMHALAAVVQRHQGWTVRPANRGRSTDDEVTLIVEKSYDR